MHIISYEIASGVPKQNWDIRYQVQKKNNFMSVNSGKITISVKSENLVSRVCGLKFQLPLYKVPVVYCNGIFIGELKSISNKS